MDIVHTFLKIIVALNLMIWNNCTGQAQEAQLFFECRDFVSNPVNLHSELYLYTNGIYEFYVESNPSDIVYPILLSHGSYRICNNNLYMKDDYYKLRMVASFSDTVLQFNIAPDFILHRRFCKYKYGNVYNASFYDEKRLLSKKQIKKYNKNKNTYQLNPGTYTLDYLGIYLFKLILKENRKFELICNESTISTGIWRQRHNIVVLKDNLGFKFIFLVSDNKLLYRYQDFEGHGSLMKFINTVD